MTRTVIRCDWCGARTTRAHVDEDGDPCCDACACAAGLEWLGDAARRLALQPAALGTAAKRAGYVSARMRPSTWDSIRKALQ